jgi:hypothetical protein
VCVCVRERERTYLRRVDSVLLKALLSKWCIVLSSEHSSSVTDILVLSLPLLHDVRRPPFSQCTNCSTVIRNSTFLDLCEEYDCFRRLRRSLVRTASSLELEPRHEDKYIYAPYG